MRIATYNIWNSPIRWPERLDAICEELLRVSPDVVALQEVPVRVGIEDRCDAAEYVRKRCGYEYVATRFYPDDPGEGSALLSKLPLCDIETGWDTAFEALGNCGLRVRVTMGDKKLAITQVHLDWSNIATREAQIVDILRWIDARSEQGCYEVLCGDFNCHPESSVYRFLMGQQTILGQSITPWHDLARYYAAKLGQALRPTLDFWHNPRWQDSPTLEIPARCDWILLRDVFNQGLPYPKVLEAGVFGTSPTPRAGVVPSDHYGVYADIEF